MIFMNILATLYACRNKAKHSSLSTITRRLMHSASFNCHYIPWKITAYDRCLLSPKAQEQIRSMSSQCDSKDKKDNENQCEQQNLQLLKLTAETDPILHSPIEEMRLEDIRSPETKQIVANMIYSIRAKQLERANAPFTKAAGMAANQWGINKRIFLFCPKGNDGEAKVVFNPTYKPISPNQVSTDPTKTKSEDQFTNLYREACFSVPQAYGIVERYTNIAISYVDINGVQHTDEQLSGWKARVWQHETDHLDGVLYSNRQSGIKYGPNCTEFHRFQTKSEFDESYPK
ncbi:unnamed protein product [Adineta ricciae]|uniref:Peptide deformylase n=1 Tax=Adineta ricciae TaxID=249248 RepID=A0A815MTZ6_ADIRI|nr:unnamed protein product [Adineta ricciae]